MEKITNKYLLQALDSYPYDIQETVEALNYALSYDENNPLAFTLMGRIYADIYKDYFTAEEYYKEALAQDLYSIDTYLYYFDLLIIIEDLVKAKKVIDYAFKISCIDKSILYKKKSLLYEKQEEYQKALELLDQAEYTSCDNSFISDLNDEKKRIKKKLKRKIKMLK